MRDYAANMNHTQIHKANQIIPWFLNSGFSHHLLNLKQPTSKTKKPEPPTYLSTNSLMFIITLHGAKDKPMDTLANAASILPLLWRIVNFQPPPDNHAATIAAASNTSNQNAQKTTVMSAKRGPWTPSHWLSSIVKVSVQTSLYKGHKFESDQKVPKVLSKVLVLTLPKVRTS